MAAANTFNAQRRLLAWGEGRDWFKTADAAAGLGIAKDAAGHALRRMCKAGRGVSRGPSHIKEWKVHYAPFIAPAKGSATPGVELTEAEILRPTKQGYYPDWPARPLLHELW